MSAEKKPATPKRTTKTAVAAAADKPKKSEPAPKAKPAPVAKPASGAKATTATKTAPAKTAGKTPSAPKAAAKPVTVAKAKTAATAATAPTQPVKKPATPSQEERQRWIATAAYHRAEKRGFAPGYEVQDWLDAEAEINALIGKA